MISWGILIRLVICVAGALTFLSLVANAIEQCEQDLRQLEQAERRARRQREQEVVLDVEPVAQVA